MIQLELLYTDQCPGCKTAARLIEKLQDEFDDLAVTHVNLLDHPEVARHHGLLATPGLIINGKLEFAGGVKEQDLRNRLLAERDAT